MNRHSGKICRKSKVKILKIDIMTLFPDMCRAVFNESIIGRAINNGILSVNAVNIRDYTTDKHGNVDDTIYGGGTGMLMTAQPVFDCYKALCKDETKPHVIYLSPQGKVFTQEKARELAKKEHIIFLCGHYEGIDQRVLDKIVDEEISIGDYVLTGGELPALVCIDALARMLDGVLPNEEAYSNDSLYNGLLEEPQYTKPAVWEGVSVPEVLLSGHHANIEKWRKEQQVEVTKRKRPDLFRN